MIALRLALRAYREFYDQIWIMLLVTMAWWGLLTTVAFAPAATLLLLRHADPRLGSWEDRPGIAESGRYLWAQLRRSWLLALATAPVIVLTAFNLSFYSGQTGILSALGPLWLVLLIAASIATIMIFAVAAVTDLTPKESIVAGARIAALRLPAALTILLVTGIVPVLVISSALYFLLPLLLATPGLIAIAFSRFALLAMRMPVPNPNLPTEERLREKRDR